MGRATIPRSWPIANARERDRQFLNCSKWSRKLREHDGKSDIREVVAEWSSSGRQLIAVIATWSPTDRGFFRDRQVCGQLMATLRPPYHQSCNPSVTNWSLQHLRVSQIVSCFSKNLVNPQADRTKVVKWSPSSRYGVAKKCIFSRDLTHFSRSTTPSWSPNDSLQCDTGLTGVCVLIKMGSFGFSYGALRWAKQMSHCLK